MKRLPFILALALLLPVSAWASGTTTFSSCVARFDLTSSGFLYDECRDLSPWRSGTTGAYKLTLTDSSGNRATADVGSAVPSGTTTMGANEVPDPGFDSACGVEWACSGSWTISGSSAAATAESDFIIDAMSIDKGELFYIGLEITDYTGGELYIRYGDKKQANETSAGVKRYYSVVKDYSSLAIDGTSGSPFTGVVDNALAQRILTPGATGLYVTDWSIDSGFDYNDSSGYTVTIRKADKGGVRSRSRNRRGH